MYPVLKSSFEHPNYACCSIQDNWMATSTMKGEVSVWDTNKPERQWSTKTDLTLVSRPIIDVESDTLVCHDFKTSKIFSLKTGKLRATVINESLAYRIHLFEDTLFAKIGTQIKRWDLTGKPLSDIDDSVSGDFVIHQGKCISITGNPSNLDISVRDIAINKVLRWKVPKLVRETPIISQGKEIIFGVKSEEHSGIMVFRLNLKTLICKTYSAKAEQFSYPREDYISAIAVNATGDQVFAGNWEGRIVTFDPDGKCALFWNYGKYAGNKCINLFVYDQLLVSAFWNWTVLLNIKDRTRIATFDNSNFRSIARPIVMVGKDLFVPEKDRVERYQFQDKPAKAEKYESKEELSDDDNV